MRPLLFSLLIFLLNACVADDIISEEKKPLEGLDWLPGLWGDTTSETRQYELWQRENDSTLVGKGVSVEGNDTVFSEKLKIISRNNKIMYIATVANQNNGQGISFTLKDTSGQKWVFENLAHDFPQRIIYRHPAQNALHARVEGNVKGKQQGQDFKLNRLNK